MNRFFGTFVKKDMILRREIESIACLHFVTSAEKGNTGFMMFHAHTMVAYLRTFHFLELYGRQQSPRQALVRLSSCQWQPLRFFVFTLCRTEAAKAGHLQ